MFFFGHRAPRPRKHGPPQIPKFIRLANSPNPTTDLSKKNISASSCSSSYVYIYICILYNTKYICTGIICGLYKSYSSWFEITIRFSVSTWCSPPGSPRALASPSAGFDAPPRSNLQRLGGPENWHGPRKSLKTLETFDNWILDLYMHLFIYCKYIKPVICAYIYIYMFTYIYTIY